MPNTVNLLVCLSPSSDRNSIDESSFYDIVNPFAPVINIKIVSRDDQIKAFVEVKNQYYAYNAISNLHGTILNVGKLNVYISNKQFISYFNPLDGVLGSLKNVKKDVPNTNIIFQNLDYDYFKSGVPIETENRMANLKQNSTDKIVSVTDHTDKITFNSKKCDIFDLKNLNKKCVNEKLFLSSNQFFK